MAGAARLSDVAKLAEVSIATASRVLSPTGDRTVNEQLVARVMDAADKLGYTPNAHAQAVARGNSNLLGLIVHDIADPYFSTIAAGVMAEADQQETAVLLASTRQSRDRELEYVAMLRAQRARAILLVGSRWDDRTSLVRLRRELDAYGAAGGRVAAISQDRLDVHTVLPLNRSGARDLAEALAAQGHTRFGILAGPEKLLTARERRQGFEAGLKEAGVTVPAAVVHGAFTRDGGHDAAQQLVRDHDVTCVFAVNDVMAVGAMAAFRHAGIGVPDQVSVAGFDDIDTLRDIAPALTTVRLPLRDMGREAAEMALGDDDRPRVSKIAGDVVLRDSTAPPSGA